MPFYTYEVEVMARGNVTVEAENEEEAEILVREADRYEIEELEADGRVEDIVSLLSVDE